MPGEEGEGRKWEEPPQCLKCVNASGHFRSFGLVVYSTPTCSLCQENVFFQLGRWGL